MEPTRNGSDGDWRRKPMEEKDDGDGGIAGAGRRWTPIAASLAACRFGVFAVQMFNRSSVSFVCFGTTRLTVSQSPAYYDYKEKKIWAC